MRRFYKSNIDNTIYEVTLDKEQSRHLRDVLRLSVGDEISIFDGNGGEFLCSVLALGKRKIPVVIKIIDTIKPIAPESPLKLTLAPTLLKGDKFELVIQKAVELGTSKLTPIITKHSDIKAKNIEKKLERWRKIIIESSKQCGRATLMKIDSPLEFNEFVETSDGVRILFSEKLGGSFSNIKPDTKMTAVIGPKGGWDNSELELAKQNGFQIITLGGRILRAETAAISLSSILQHNFGDIL